MSSISSITTAHAPQHDMIDLLVIGGGVNGCGIARDAAGRGASVMLVEQDDLAGHTSSASTKLIHGGLRYLEYYEFRLVREALIERDRLLKIAPHIIWPMRFVLPHSKLLRPAWLLRLGLFIYDHLAPNMTLPRTRAVRLQQSSVGAGLKPEYTKGFIYSDGWVQDSRLVALNAMDAASLGADINTRTRLIGATRQATYWEATLEDTETGARRTIKARTLVNAAGPWVAKLLHRTLAVSGNKQVRMVKGSHIVVPRQFDGPQAYILQNPDKRIIFAIPYENDYTLIGTTDIPWTQDPGHVEISGEEITYLCDSFNRYFSKSVSPADVKWTYAGVRPLYDDAAANASAVTRDYVLDLNTDGGAPVLSIFGGKITTYRKLAEHALEKLAPVLSAVSSPGWTASRPLPGGDFQSREFDKLLARLRAKAPYLDKKTAWRLARNYGTRAFDIAGRAAADLGQDFGGGLSEREVDYLMDHEWARTAQDVLWRRSKLGLVLDQAQVTRLDAYMTHRRTAPSVSHVA
ncbi:glycerol-3-phosphate dehydrogenase [Tanticharoenia sakaeratensis]|uniref:Glycerol-3-phosphate dehydrogenase n=1 Tax=Tanticharoenia sakaeratensis NBRC 103193 TaxID=1231623 RepID=A0A0D6ML06_9PROT|nr:glycerol-3-phosphate dehydrogenase [Tanticharoenia sakaeratensis]GAN53958.1 glycerol-3-phosphate dehydrogenase [Tanticharoenia sakaeratensis NBRC 103193]GBQ25362.1 glycerol-3-phosphate dehydrogenase [Tanticharoenia sakaeratensis NBRC 103193]